MNVRKGSLIVLLTLVLSKVQAETIISVDSPDNQGYGCLVIYNSQGYRVGWTQADTYDAVTVSAKLTSSGAVNQTGRAFLTTQIGPGTSTNNEIVSSSFTFPLEVTNVVLFQGLHLLPGSYYRRCFVTWRIWIGRRIGCLFSGNLTLFRFGGAPGIFNPRHQHRSSDTTYQPGR